MPYKDKEKAKRYCREYAALHKEANALRVKRWRAKQKRIGKYGYKTKPNVTLLSKNTGIVSEKCNTPSEDVTLPRNTPSEILTELPDPRIQNIRLLQQKINGIQSAMPIVQPNGSLSNQASSLINETIMIPLDD